MNTQPLLPHILVVDDDDRLRDLLRRYLSENGFIVTMAADAAEACEKMQSLQFDLMVLDIMMPGETGLELAARLKHAPDYTPPILLLTAMGEPQDRIEGFEAGADDYLTKPFEPRELLLRIQAILRRIPQPDHAVPQSEVTFGDYRFDIKRGRLLRGEELVRLTTQEQEILSVLASNAGRPVSRDNLAQASGNERSVDVQINRLRKKLESTPAKPLYIITARGAGYVLQVD
ncbi:MAG: response regulator transcription factor [Alphaproteobacteria bacterium]|nr:response regulator transcription factor [Alphaproteobacteria bacterium]